MKYFLKYQIHNSKFQIRVGVKLHAVKTSPSETALPCQIGLAMAMFLYLPMQFQSYERFK